MIRAARPFRQFTLIWIESYPDVFHVEDVKSVYEYKSIKEYDGA